MYIEKIFQTKIYRNNQSALDRLGLKRNCAEGTTANHNCKIKVRAIGLDYKDVTHWLEQPEQQDSISILNQFAESAPLDPKEVTEDEVQELE